MHLLESVFEHRPILFNHEFAVDMDAEVGTDAQEVSVIRSVVNFAQAQPVLNDRLAERFTVRNDVSCVEQLSVPQLADATTRAVSADYASAKLRLVEAYACQPLALDGSS